MTNMPKFELQSDKPIIMSIGGSLVVPDGGPDVEFLRAFRGMVEKGVEKGFRFILVIGGGSVCRVYQNAARKLVENVSDEDLDWIGIGATKFNSLLVTKVLGDLVSNDVIEKPIDEPVAFDRGAVVVSGWEPGNSSDYVICQLAQLHGATAVINASNIDYVFDADPRENPEAKPFEEMSWAEYRKMVGDDWDPGLSAPFDPVASKFCDENGISVAIVNGSDMKNIGALIAGEDFKGTILS